MDSTGFDPANWSHWLLVGCFMAVSICGLVLSWRWSVHKRIRRRWHQRMQAERRRLELTHQLTMELYEVPRRLPEALNLSVVRDVSRK